MAKQSLISTGVPGLDDILHGGLTSGHVYLVEGDPGTGKTTLGLQFLLAGVAKGEKALYVTLAESKKELEQVAASHGWDISQIEIYQVAPPELQARPEQQYTVFHPSEVELADVMHSVLARVEESSASRVVIDSMSEFRMLAREALRYRRQVLYLKQFFTGRNCSVVLLDDRTSEQRDISLLSIAHGAVRLENLDKEYGVRRRRLEIAKMRASTFREGYHDYIIVKGGLDVFPRLVTGEHRRDVKKQKIASGLKDLDNLFGGGVDSGSSTLIMGPAGSGKSTIATRYVLAAAQRGDKAAIFTFDEQPSTLLQRSNGLGIPLEEFVTNGTVHLEQVDPAELSPGEFIHRIRRGVEREDWKVVVIDSLNGLLNSMAEEKGLTVQLHELLSYLSQVGVASFMVVAQFGILGHGMSSPIDVSYLSDNVLLLRYFEALGEVRQAISVVKRRAGFHERNIREFHMKPGEISVGAPLKEFEGVLTGTPRYFGGTKPLL